MSDQWAVLRVPRVSYVGPSTERAMFETLRQTATLIGPGEWRRWALLVVLALVLSGFEMVGAGLVYALISLVSTPDTPIDLPLIGDITRFVEDPQADDFLIALVIVLATFFLVRAAVRVGTVYAQSRVAHNAGARLSKRLVAGYLRAPYEFHLHRSSSELIRNSHQAVNQVINEVFLPIVRMSAETLIVIGLVIMMIAIAPIAAALAVLVVGGVSLLLLLAVQPRHKRLGQIAHQTNKETLSILQQALHGIRDIKILARERWFTHSFGKSRLRMARAFYLRSTLAEIPRTSIELSLVGFILGFFALTVATNENPEEALSVLGLFAYVGLRLQPSIQRIVNGLNSLKYASAPLNDLAADLEIIEFATHDEIEPLPFEHEIVLQDVGFVYERAADNAVRGVDLTIRRGEQIGICGPTGGGKTTLVDLISGLLEPTSGSISVDGDTLNGHVRRWQRNLGVVPQVVFLMDDTLRRNIALGVSDRDIDEDAVQEAVDLAQLREFVDSLPNGLDTSVGERGIRISGGQRQRIAIARALYRRPDVLIFDEGTSALDNTTEAALMEAIETLRGQHTIILVAHRLSTVKDSDRIVFVERGAITGQGTYQDLMSHPSFRIMAEG